MRDFIRFIGFLVVFFGMVTFASIVEDHYTREATVVDVAPDGCVTFCDRTGTLWSWGAEDVDEFVVGEQHKLYMSASGTIDDTRDDVILRVR